MPANCNANEIGAASRDATASAVEENLDVMIKQMVRLVWLAQIRRPDDRPKIAVSKRAQRREKTRRS
jgi:hypothetical protein